MARAGGDTMLNGCPLKTVGVKYLRTATLTPSSHSSQMATQKAPTHFNMFIISRQSKSKAYRDPRRVNSLLRPSQNSTKVFDNIELKTLPKTARRVVLGLRPRRAMTCEVLSRWIPLENDSIKFQQLGFLHGAAINSPPVLIPKSLFWSKQIRKRTKKKAKRKLWLRREGENFPNPANKSPTLFSNDFLSPVDMYPLVKIV
ncbi:hypothetical protein ACTXT7_016421 [Hymenolepis weldensis]